MWMSTCYSFAQESSTQSDAYARRFWYLFHYQYACTKYYATRCLGSVLGFYVHTRSLIPRIRDAKAAPIVDERTIDMNFALIPRNMSVSYSQQIRRSDWL